MTLDEIKNEMLEYRDFHGGDIYYTDDIKSAKTEKDLAEILDRYRWHLEDVANDAQSHLENFRKKLNISIFE